MEIIVVACVATIAACAILSRATRSAPQKPLRGDSSNRLDQGLFHLINEVARKPEKKRGQYVDRVHLGDRLGSLRKRETWV
ncbi:MAG: hypothetical protein QM831_06215 [Kofleriaceae bacterium]